MRTSSGDFWGLPSMEALVLGNPTPSRSKAQLIRKNPSQQMKEGSAGNLSRAAAAPSLTMGPVQGTPGSLWAMNAPFLSRDGQEELEKKGLSALYEQTSLWEARPGSGCGFCAAGRGKS